MIGWIAFFACVGIGALWRIERGLDALRREVVSLREQQQKALFPPFDTGVDDPYARLALGKLAAIDNNMADVAMEARRLKV